MGKGGCLQMVVQALVMALVILLLIWGVFAVLSQLAAFVP